jgi:hypothetical protein
MPAPYGQRKAQQVKLVFEQRAQPEEENFQARRDYAGWRLEHGNKSAQ